MSTLQQSIQRYLHPQTPQRTHTPADQPLNVSDTERIVSGVVGAVLVKSGLGRGSLGGLALAGFGAGLLYRCATGHCGVFNYLGVTSRVAAPPEKYNDHGIHVRSAVTIEKPAAELYAYWSTLDNLPRFMRHLISVTVLDDKTSRWVAKGPAGTQLQWDAEIINEEKDKLIAWRSLGGAQVDNAGSVRFLEAPGGRGTEVHVVLDYVPPGRTVGKWIAKLLGEEPQLQIDEDLKRFKQLMETGEVPTISGQPRGAGRTQT